MKDKDKVLTNETCYSVHAKCKQHCTRSQCRYWFNNPQHQNCSIIAAHEGPKTLEEVGKLYNLTRMRICQIESSLRKKLRVIS